MTAEPSAPSAPPTALHPGPPFPSRAELEARFEHARKSASAKAQVVEGRLQARAGSGAARLDKLECRADLCRAELVAASAAAVRAFVAELHVTGALRGTRFYGYGSPGPGGTRVFLIATGAETDTGDPIWQ